MTFRKEDEDYFTSFFLRCCFKLFYILSCAVRGDLKTVEELILHQGLRRVSSNHSSLNHSILLIFPPFWSLILKNMIFPPLADLQRPRSLFLPAMFVIYQATCLSPWIFHPSYFDITCYYEQAFTCKLSHGLDGSEVAYKCFDMVCYASLVGTSKLSHATE